MDARPVDFILCQYGNSKICFGVRKILQALLWCLPGGADTFGGKVPDPFSALLEREMGMPILNLGRSILALGFTSRMM